ncbi:MAG: serine/threonine protein kinase, partial [Cyanothece sp. SIO1E1]|nr:serine/threonine protein kinase [Cyanothece sp. SIO1E1]
MRHSRYRILGLVGQGQFGQVFCAVDRQTGQLVALKALSYQRFPTSQFLREFRFLVTLKHPNIVACQSLTHTTQGRYLVMDYCAGGTLRNLLKQAGALTLREGLQLILGVLAGLDYAHRQGIIHRDIKPENILLALGPAGWMPQLSDFGIACPRQELPQKQKMMGSLAYSAPETFYGFDRPTSDLYAVGIVLFELLTGDRPFTGTPAALTRAHLSQGFQMPSSLPQALQEILQKALEKLPARRFAKAPDMAQA